MLKTECKQYFLRNKSVYYKEKDMAKYSKDELFKLILTNIPEFNEIKNSQGSLDLSELELGDAEITQADFSGCDLTGSDFSQSNLTEVNFAEADLSGVNFSRANFTECDFTYANLTGADLSYSVVNYCNFSEADMTGAQLIEADLTDSDFSNCETLNATRFDDGTIWPDNDKLPDEFDTTYAKDLSSLDDEEDNKSSFDY